MSDDKSLFVKRYNADCWQIWADQKIVGFANKLANGGWGAFDNEDRRTSPVIFKKPKDVAAWVQAKHNP